MPTSSGASCSASPAPGSDLAVAVDRAVRDDAAGLAAHGPEGLDVLRPVRRLGPVPRPHHRSRTCRSRRASPPSRSTCGPTASRCDRWCRSPASPTSTRCSSTSAFVPDDRVIGDGERRLAGVVVDPHPRAGHQPPPARHPRPATSRSCSGWRSSAARFDDDRAAAAAGRRPTSRCASSSSTTGARSRGSAGADARPGGLGAQAVLVGDEPAAARHGDGRARCRGRRRATTRATASGSGRGSTTRRPRSSPARTRSSATSSASGCSACLEPDRR